MNLCRSGDPQTLIRRSYIICATPRCGSNFLCEVLQATGVAGRPDEYFWNPPDGHERWSVSELGAYVGQIRRAGATPNGVFGFKIMWSHLGDWLPRLGGLVGREDARPPDILAATFPGLRYVRLTRYDKVRQAVSFYRAAVTSQWRSMDPGNELAAAPEFDFAAIDYLVNDLITGDQGWDQFYRKHSIEPLYVKYEDLERSPEAVSDKVLEFLGLTPPGHPIPNQWRHQRQADGLSDDWVRQYHVLKGSVPG